MKFTKKSSGWRSTLSSVLVVGISLQLMVPPSMAAQGFTGPQWTNGLTATKANFAGSARWKTAPAFTTKTLDGSMKVQVFQRFVDFGLQPISIGTVTYMEIPKTGEWAKAGTNSQSFAATVREMLKGPEWVSRKQSGADVYTADWIDGNRFVQIFYKDKGNHVEISISAIRRAYAYPVAIESELLQRQLAKDAGVVLREWIQNGYAMLDSTDAQAESLLCTLGLCGTGGSSISSGSGSSVLSSIGSAGSQLSSALQSTDTNFGGVTTAVNGLSGNINSAVSTAGKAVSTAQGINVTAQNINVTAQNGINSFNAAIPHIDNDTAQVSNAINHASDTINKVASPRNAFLMGAAGVAGGALAAAVVGIGLEALGNAISALYYAAIGRLPPDQREALTAKVGAAVKQLKDNAEAFATTERQVDQELAALAKASDADSMEHLGLVAQANINYLNEILKRDDAEMGALDGDDLMTCSMQKASTQQEIKLYQSIQAIIERSPDGTPARDVLCEALDGLLQQWAIVESDLDSARQVLINNETYFVGMIEAAAASANDQTSLRRQHGECKAHAKDFNSSTRNFDLSLSDCIKDRYASMHYDPSKGVDAQVEADAKKFCSLDDSKDAVIAARDDQNLSTCDLVEQDQKAAEATGRDRMINSQNLLEARLTAVRHQFDQLHDQSCLSSSEGCKSQGKTAFEKLAAKKDAVYQKAAKQCPSLQVFEDVHKQQEARVQQAVTPPPPAPAKQGFWASIFHPTPAPVQNVGREGGH